MAEREREDDLALERLDADTYRAGLLDAIYRMPEVYIDNDRLFGTPAPDDALLYSTRQLIAALHSRVPRATFYAPLGVGNHVDHQIVYAAAREGAGAVMAFYEDFPYMLRVERVRAAHARAWPAICRQYDRHRHHADA